MITKHSLWVLMGLPRPIFCSFLQRAEKVPSQAEFISRFRDPDAESPSALVEFSAGNRNAVVLSEQNMTSKNFKANLRTFREADDPSEERVYAAAEGLVQAVLEVPGADETTFPVVWAGDLTERGMGGSGWKKLPGAKFWHRDRSSFLEWLLMGESLVRNVDCRLQKLLVEFDAKFANSVFVKAFASAMVATMVVDKHRDAIVGSLPSSSRANVDVADLLWKVELRGSRVG